MCTDKETKSLTYNGYYVRGAAGGQSTIRIFGAGAGGCLTPSWGIEKEQLDKGISDDLMKRNQTETIPQIGVN